MASDVSEDGPTGTKRDRITIDPSPAMRRYLKQLVRLGIYGKTPTAVATRLIDEGVRQALRDSLITREQEED